MHEMIEGGFASFRDAIFAERMANHRTRLEVINGEIRLIEKQQTKQNRRVTPGVVPKFPELLAAKLGGADPVLRRGDVQALVDEVLVSEGEIVVIRGSRKSLEFAAASPKAA